MEFTVIERCDKETEEVLAQEGASFLKEPVSYFKKHINEFVYTESPAFEEARIDSLSIELDEVFRLYMGLFGFRAQKKFGDSIKSFLKENLIGEEVRSSVMFSNEDGLWEMNIPLDSIEGFNEEMSMEDAAELMHRFLINLVNSIG
ncbi:hypothetical protein ACFOZY_04455 [Chungangia koreensis]|uniref:Protoporphyrinogen oxidase n=1 Tax=Chungangia koreensis TaxID=752657 RepID=A0ABV8X6I0_9LACT